jgi:hypothetical protein
MNRQREDDSVRIEDADDEENGDEYGITVQKQGTFLNTFLNANPKNGHVRDMMY